MKSVKLLHCADIHLDMPFTSLGSAEGKAALRRNEIKEAFHRIITLSIMEQVDLLLICGDLYEHEYVRRSTISFISDEFNKIPKTTVIIIPGNHDPYLPGSYFKTFKWPDNVHILAGEKDFIELEESGIRIFNSLSRMIPEKPSSIDILMLHGTLNMNIARNAYNPLTSDKLDSSGMDYIALGHFHNHFKVEGKTRTAFNPGSPEPLGFDEEGSHGVYITEIFLEDNGWKHSEAKYVFTNKRNYRNIIVNTDGCGTDEKIAEITAAAITDSSSEDLFSITLKGTVERGYRVDTRMLEASLKEQCFFVRIKDATVPGYDFEEIMKEYGLKSLFVKKMLERVRTAEIAGDEGGRRLALDSLYYGMEAMEQGEICL